MTNHEDWQSWEASIWGRPGSVFQSTILREAAVSCVISQQGHELLLDSNDMENLWFVLQQYAASHDDQVS